MACDSCCPGYYDHGFNLSDSRVTYEILGDLQHYDDCEDPENCDCDERDTTRLEVRIERQWKDCDCGYGTDYTCIFRVYKDGKDDGVWFDTQHKAEEWISVQYPKAQLPEPDPDWESERWLRRAEGWGC